LNTFLFPSGTILLSRPYATCCKPTMNLAMRPATAIG
jgi:hypothetical protein